jgi:hypothetical protein
MEIPIVNKLLDAVLKRLAEMITNRGDYFACRGNDRQVRSSREYGSRREGQLFDEDSILLIDPSLLSLLLSPSLTIENQDSLLQKLIDLGSDYFDYWCEIGIPLLSTQSIAQFVNVFRFDELRSHIRRNLFIDWLVFRLGEVTKDRH